MSTEDILLSINEKLHDIVDELAELSEKHSSWSDSEVDFRTELEKVDNHIISANKRLVKALDIYIEEIE